jgi:single-strand DNA-binding protein
MSVNKVTLLGNVGQDPKISATQDGREIANFSLATTESWKDKNTGEKRDKTEWHKVVIFSQGLVGVVKNYVKKGSKLYIEGSLQTRMWEKDCVKHYTTEIVLQGFNSTLLMLDSRNDSEIPNNSNIATSEQQASHDKGFAEVEQMIDDEVPF